MSTALQVIEHWAPLLGLRPATLDRQLRAQRLAGQVPTGGPGGGRASAHFDDHHLAHAMLGLFGPMPSDGPEAALAFRGLPYRGTENPPADIAPALPTLEDMLAYWISEVATLLGRGCRADDPGFDLIRSWKMALCLNPLSAIITLGPDDNQTTHVYAAEPGPDLAMRRLTILSGNLLMAAGELLADTIEQRHAVACLQFLGETQPTKAGQENENAGHLRQEVPASTRTTDRSASNNHQIGTLTTPTFTGELRENKERTLLADGHPTPLLRDRSPWMTATTD